MSARHYGWRGPGLLLILLFVFGALAQGEPEPGADGTPPKSEKPESDAEPEEEKIPLEDLAKEFTLPDPHKKNHSLSDYKDKYVVLEWINHGCPFVKKHYNAGTMQALQKKYAAKGVIWLSICSSAPGKQGHMSAEKWRETVKAKGAAPTVVLLDPDGKVGRLYRAARTPHMVVIDPKQRILFEGAIDDAPRAFDAESVKAAFCYVSAVLDAALSGKESPYRKVPAYGCSVKYAR